MFNDALKVEMTEMPELVAILHSFVGLAAVLVGFNSYGLTHETDPVLMNIHNVEVFLGIFIGCGHIHRFYRSIR